MYVVGLDIGGAHIKVADNDGRTRLCPFAIWKSPNRLPPVLAELLAMFADSQAFAVTMTAELADCFQTKAEGVDFVLRAVEDAAGQTPVFVWQTGAEFVTPAVARDIPLLVAAANWHAQATWLGRMVPEGAALMVDVGSTTTDVIPLLDGVPVPCGLTDFERLQSGELVYTGVRRTPVCAIAHSVPLRDGWPGLDRREAPVAIQGFALPGRSNPGHSTSATCPLAAELFATTADVYLTLGKLPEEPDNCNTADGRPATRRAAHDRLARAVCCDRTQFAAEDADVMARFLCNAQKQKIRDAVDLVLGGFTHACRTLLLAGSGEFLAEEIAGKHPRLQSAETMSLSAAFDRHISDVAGAWAVAHLAAERLPGLD